MSTLTLHFYGSESYEDIYAALARVFPVKTGGEHSWIEVRIDEKASMTFFAADTPAKVEVEA